MKFNHVAQRMKSAAFAGVYRFTIYQDVALSRALALAVARARLTCETSAPAAARKHMDM